MIILLILIILIGVFFFRTIAYREIEDSSDKNKSNLFPIETAAINRLSSFIKLKTISYNNLSKIDMLEHRKVESFFLENFPLTCKTLNMTKINDFAYIFQWDGKDKSRKPILLTAHFDVVPAKDEGWELPPFSGEIQTNQIWGRGTLDTKNTLVGILESAEKLVSQGFIPEKTLYFAFGGDEEIMGMLGARSIVEYFKTKNISFDWVLDEGSIIAKDILTMTNKPIALIGIAEKGFANVKLIAKGIPGHAAMPPEHTASGLIGRAVFNLEKKPSPVKLTRTVRNFLKSLIPHVSFPLALVFSNLWFFSPIVKYSFKKSPTTAALVRTTQAVTILEGSKKDNVLPNLAEAVVNVRILPGELKNNVLNRMKTVVNDPLISVEFTNYDDASDPVKESDINSDGYIKIKSTINKVYPKGIVSPFLVTATTDSRHYKEITDNIFRFVPMVLTSEDLSKIHGFNESISVENYTLIINFFTELIRTI